jgi:guanylate kinase
MKNLFLVDGASGTGKSDLLKWASENNADDVGFIRKGTTRQQRDYEASDPEILLDLEFLSKEGFETKHYDYTYTYGGARYGLFRKELTKKLIKHNNVFAIVRNTGTIRKIADDHSFVNVVPIFIYTDRAELTKRLERSGASKEGIAFRLGRSDIAERDYYSHPDVYKEILINNSAREIFHNTIDRLVAKYGAMPSIDPYLISVMMSFNPKNRTLEDSYDAIEQAIKGISSKFDSRRVDKAPGSPKIASEFRNLIARSRCIIVDLTENKQNVYYELGYIQASGKSCIITAQEGTVPFFYPREHKIIFYASARELRERLKPELEGLLQGLPL